MTKQLPEACRAGLADLYHKSQHATLLYNTAVNAAITAIGLDPNDDNELNLDTGVITLAKPKQ